MKNNSELLEIVGVISTFKVLTISQVQALLGCDRALAIKLIKKVHDQGRISVNHDSQLVVESPDLFDKADKKVIAAFWVFLKFIDKADYYTHGEFPICVSFFSEGEHYEIVYVAFGNEVTVNHILSQLQEDSKRLVIIEDKSQIEKLDIPGLLSFCMVDTDGEVAFYKIE